MDDAQCLCVVAIEVTQEMQSGCVFPWQQVQSHCCVLGHS